MPYSDALEDATYAAQASWDAFVLARQDAVEVAVASLGDRIEGDTAQLRELLHETIADWSWRTEEELRSALDEAKSAEADALSRQDRSDYYARVL